MKDRGLKIMVVTIAAAVILGFLGLLYTYDDKPIESTPNYTVHIFDNGAATISVENIGYVQQLQECTQFGAGYYLKPGTLIIPGVGEKTIYEYPQRDVYIRNNE